MLRISERSEGWRRWHPTTWGLKFILAYNLAENILFFAVSFMELVIFVSPKVLNIAKVSSRLTVCGYSLLGLPMLACGIWGLAKEQERFLRFYSYYMVASVLVNSAYTIDALVHFLPCADMAAIQNPTIFQCGHPRGYLLMVFCTAVTLQAALFYPVYACCEDFAYANEGRRVPGGKGGQDDEKGPRGGPRQLAIAAQWAALRNGPLSQIQGSMVGEYGAVCEVAPLLGGQPGMTCAIDNRPPHLPPSSRLV